MGEHVETGYENIREDIVNLNPPEALERLKRHECPVCGVPKSKFNPRMRNYCTPAHREEYTSKIFTWAEMRQRILERDKNTCRKCGINPEKYHEEDDERRKVEATAWGEAHPDDVEKLRSHYLERSEEYYQKAMDDAALKEEAGQRKISFQRKYISLEVDHIKPIALGGAMWDEANLWVLCEECHDVKTAVEAAAIAAVRKYDARQEKLGVGV